MKIGRSDQTQHEINNLIYRAKRHGLNNGQTAIWHGLIKWFDNNPDGPTTRQLADISGVSTSLVNWTLPVLEELGYITCSRRRNGSRITKSIRLWVYPESEEHNDIFTHA